MPIILTQISNFQRTPTSNKEDGDSFNALKLVLRLIAKRNDNRGGDDGIYIDLSLVPIFISSLTNKFNTYSDNAINQHADRSRKIKNTSQ